MGRGKRAPHAAAAPAVAAQAPLVFYPSDLTWLYSECPRCFYLKMRYGIKPPGGGMPNIFRVIDGAIRHHCMTIKRTEDICPEMPPGEFIRGEHWVHSANYAPLPGHKLRFTFGGKPDAVVQWDAGGYGVIDFKTTSVKPSSAPFYSKQLEIYTRALEQPPTKGRDKADALTPFTLNGLLAWEPMIFGASDAESLTDMTGAEIETKGGALDLKGKLTWIPVARTDVDLGSFLDPVMTLLEQDDVPAPGKGCRVCSYYDAMRRLETPAA